MNIVINTRFLIKNKLEGIGRFTLESVKRMCINHPEHTFYLLFDRMYDKEYVFAPNVKPIIVPFQARHPFLWWFWFHVQIPRVLESIKADVFLSTDGYLPLKGNTSTVNVIHDLNFEHNPQQLPWLVRKYYLHFFPKYAAIATRIATVSEYSKQDICKTYSIPESKVDVVYNGVSSEFSPLLEGQKTIIKNGYTNGQDYFVYVGSLHPRKNIERLLQAYEIFKEKTNSPLQLVIVGEAMFMAKSIQQIYEKHKFKNEIVFTGRVSNTELGLLLGSAYAMTYVPLFEGFGIPIIEAFSCNVPVVTSNTTSMPEVGGNAALYCDPYSVESIADAMIRIQSHPELYEQMLAASQEQVQKFSWDNTSNALWKSVETVLQLPKK